MTRSLRTVFSSRLSFRTAFVLMGMLAASVITPPAESSAAESPSTEMVRLVNELRAQNGLRVLQVDPTLQQSVDRWTAGMAAQGRIFHNKNLMNELPPILSKVGENVGFGSTMEDIENAFVNSPGHLSNLLDPQWDAMAVGVVVSADGRMFITQQFQDVRDEALNAPAVVTAGPLAVAGVKSAKKSRVRSRRPVRVRR